VVNNKNATKSKNPKQDDSFVSDEEIDAQEVMGNHNNNYKKQGKQNP
jgi:hypothetical protein